MLQRLEVDNTTCKCNRVTLQSVICNVVGFNSIFRIDQGSGCIIEFPLTAVSKVLLGLNRLRMSRHCLTVCRITVNALASVAGTAL